MKKFLFAFVFGILISSGITSQAQPNGKIVRKIAVGGDGGWDYITVDGASARIYASHSTEAVVIDSKSGKVIDRIADTKGIHGIALAPELNKGYTSNGKDSSITIFDLKTLKTLQRVQVTGSNPDCILYDGFSKKIYTFNGRSADVTVLDATTLKVVATIKVDGKPEFAATDLNGHIFVNIEDKNSISVIDAKTFKVINRWSIAPGEEPSGLAMDKQTHRLFSVCRNKLMVVIDALSGKIITTLPIGERCDGVAYDAQKKRIYSSNGEGTITVVQEENANTFKVIETIKSLPGARTIGVDPLTHHLYLPTAEFGAPVAGERRPPIKSGTFMILDIDPGK
jgi:YVTN family beta-propeller protein